MDKFLLYHTFLRDYDSHLIMQDIDKFDVKIIVILKGLKKYMAFTVNTKFSFY